MSDDRAIIWTIEEYLVQLVSEACEIGHVTTKCHQFGLRHVFEGIVNVDALSGEIGDLLGVCDGLPINWDIVARNRSLKRIKMDRVRRDFEKATGKRQPQKDETDEHQGS